MNNALQQIDPSGASLPEVYENAQAALSECVKIDECQSWADKAAALASYARQADDDSMRKMADRIKARAIRRAGELWKQVDGRKQNRETVGDHSLPTGKQLQEDLGVSDHKRFQSVKVANVPEGDFNKAVESDNPPTVTKLAEQGTKRQAVDLGNRTKEQYNKAMHFEAMFIRYAKEIKKWNIDEVIEVLSESERKQIRESVEAIDAIHDQVITRI